MITFEAICAAPRQRKKRQRREELSAKVASATGLAVDVQLEELPERLSPRRELDLYHAVLELFNNALHHSGATTLSLTCGSGMGSSSSTLPTTARTSTWKR